MPSVKCDNCGHSFDVVDATKKYRFPLLLIFLGLAILACENAVSNPYIVITILGGIVTTGGFIWLVVARIRSGLPLPI